MSTIKKTIRLDNLVDGTPFVVPSLEKEFRLMYLIRGGQSTCKVQGYKITESGGYSPFTGFFAPGTEVNFDKTRMSLPVSEKQEVLIPKEYINALLEKKQENKQENKKEKNMNTENNNVKRGVGRPKKHRVNLPLDQEMTVAQMAKALGVEKFIINNEIARIKKEHPDKIEVVGKAPTQAKGKPAKVFKLSI